MSADELQELVDGLRAGAVLPRRVVVDARGNATSARLAVTDYGIRPALVFVRGDGWTLGAPVALAGVAYAMWSRQWVAVVGLPEHAAAVWSPN